MLGVLLAGVDGSAEEIVVGFVEAAADESAEALTILMEAFVTDLRLLVWDSAIVTMVFSVIFSEVEPVTKGFILIFTIVPLPDFDAPSSTGTIYANFILLFVVDAGERLYVK